MGGSDLGGGGDFTADDAGAPDHEDGSADAGLEEDAWVDAATGGNFDDAGLGIGATVSLGDLTDAQRGLLCDWMNDQLGGYGQVTDCGGGILVQNASDQQECLTTSFGFRCDVTVAELEQCVLAQAPSHGCIFVASACRPLLC